MYFIKIMTPIALSRSASSKFCIRRGKYMNVFNDFNKRIDVEESTIRKYSDRVPEQVMHLWEQIRLGSFLNG